MVGFIILWAVCVLFSFVSAALREFYMPVKKLADFLLTLFMLVTLSTQLVTIYSTAQRSAALAMAAVIAFDSYWFRFAPFYPNSDAAGNGMARAFRGIFITGASLVLGLISFFLIKFLVPGDTPVGLYIVLIFAGHIGLYNLFGNRRSFMSGDSFEQAARWAKMRGDDYRKTLFRAGMLEKHDSWEAKELDASPKELEHFDVYGCKCVNIRTHGRLPCLLLEGHFEFPNDSAFNTRRTGLVCGCLGYTAEGDANDRTYYVPNLMKLVWHDLTDGKSYKTETELPKELDRYFEDTDRFWLDDIDFLIMPKGKVLMFHSRHNQIHNIMIDYPLHSEPTNEYSEKVEKLISEFHVDAEKCRAQTPEPETIDDYLKRFRYRIVFLAEDGLTVTKTICNFFNAEKILSDGEWKEQMQPARIKDAFLRFESAQQKYAAFVYFSEDEIIKAFDETFGDCGDLLGEFVIRVGRTQSGFAFELKLGERCLHLSQTEIRLYKTNANDAGKLVFKNYKGEHQNLLRGLEIKR